MAGDCCLTRRLTFMRCADKGESVSGLAHYSQFPARLAGHGAGLNTKVDTLKLTLVVPSFAVYGGAHLDAGESGRAYG